MVGFLRGAVVVVLLGIASSSMAGDFRLMGGDIVWADAEQPLDYVFGVENITGTSATMAGWTLTHCYATRR